MLTPRLRPTIRTRLTLAAAALAITMLLVAGLALVAIQRRALTQGLDESLRQTADNVAPASGSIGDLPPIGDPEDTFVQILDGHDVVASTTNLSDAAVIDPTRGFPIGISTQRIARPDGQFRVLVRQLEQDGADRWLIVGRNLDDVSDSVHILIVALAVVSPALVLLLGALSWWLVGRTLRPVDAIRQEVQGIGGAELHRRVPVPDTDDEIAVLARTMNDMLTRVQNASDQQQRFVDDASHELRTPLTRMLTDLDVALAHPDSDDPTQILRRLHDDASDLHTLLEDLLYLARSSHNRTVPDTEVDLDDLALTVAHEARTRTDHAIDTRAIQAVTTRGDERSLRRAIGNVVDNAVHHASSTVTIAVQLADGTAQVVVDDDGPGIPPESRAHVLERFVRLDEARARDDGGSGLGLAIAQEIVTRHRGLIEINDSPIGGARVTISLPSGAGDHESGDA